MCGGGGERGYDVQINFRLHIQWQVNSFREKNWFNSVSLQNKLANVNMPRVSGVVEHGAALSLLAFHVEDIEQEANKGRVITLLCRLQHLLTICRSAEGTVVKHKQRRSDHSDLVRFKSAVNKRYKVQLKAAFSRELLVQYRKKCCKQTCAQVSLSVPTRV